MSEAVSYPPYDPELVAALSAVPVPPVNDETLDMWRGAVVVDDSKVADDLARCGVKSTEHIIEGPRGEIQIVSFAPQGGVTSAPAIYHIHGGGMIMGTRYTGITPYRLIEWVEKYQLVLVSVEYRMAPEVPGLAAVEDCEAGLVWTADHAAELGIDADRIIILGPSGGGGLAAGTALLNRDTGGPALLAQILWCPQLDDRCDSVSTKQFERVTGAGLTWTHEDNQYAWDLVLGENHENRDDVSMYASANRAEDLSGLPPAFIDVGSNEVFRDPAVQYASKLWAAGVSAELHVWPGGFHAFDCMFPHVPVAAAAQAAQEDYLRRVLGEC